MKNSQLHIVDHDDYHIGIICGKEICRFEYWQDDAGLCWLNSAETQVSYQKNGFGTKMIKFAINAFGEVYFSKGSKFDHDGDDSDTRYLSNEGAALAKSCLRKGIIKEEWYFNPFLDDMDYDD